MTKLIFDLIDDFGNHVWLINPLFVFLAFVILVLGFGLLLVTPDGRDVSDPRVDAGLDATIAVNAFLRVRLLDDVDVVDYFRSGIGAVKLFF